MFLGIVHSEVELRKAHPAFEGLRLLLVAADQEVDWKGNVLAVDTVGARVGDVVITALAPLGDQFDIPADLPVGGAVVGVVSAFESLESLASDDEANEDDGPDERPRRGRRPGGRDRGGREGASREGSERPRRRARSEEPAPAFEEVGETAEAEEAPTRGRSRPARGDGGDEEERPAKRARRSRSRSDEEEEKAPRRSRSSRSAPTEDEPEADEAPARKPRAKAKPAEPEGDEDLMIVWDAPEAGDAEGTVGAAKKRSKGRRRR